jgi:hypothetical protein
MIDLDDFKEQYAEALSQAAEFSRRSKKGLPGDRLASERQLHLVAKGIEAQMQIMAWQAETLAALMRSQNEQVEQGRQR